MSKRRFTKEEFIAKAREKHGDKYGYSNVVYNGDNTKVFITCPVHGDFPQTPHAHKAGQGCPKCAKERSRIAQTASKDEFIAKAREKHGDKYSYDRVEYINVITPVIITCPKHGDFPMTPNNHKAGHGCPTCARERIKASLMDSKEGFITKARMIHGDNYIYDKVIYKGNNKKVNIICPKHGEFEVTPSNHKLGCGCQECKKEKIKEVLTDSIEEFITKAKAVHGNKYDYSKVVYKGSNKKVTIICPKHGEFEITPHKHKTGQGCSKCNQSHLETETRALLEQNNITYEPQMKFTWLMSSKNYPMKLDFYLPEYNVAIECQGIQHYLVEGNGFFTDEDISSIQQNDKLKFQLCQDHNLPIYYIKYNENIKERIGSILNELKTKMIT